MSRNVKKQNTISPTEFITSLSIHHFLLKTNTLFTKNPPMDLVKQRRKRFARIVSH